MKRLSTAEQSCSQNLRERDTILVELNKNLKMRGMLEKMTKSIFEKNISLYQQHEEMLDDEKAKRVELADSFQKRMAEVTSQINDVRSEREKEFKANQEVRKKIQDQVGVYKQAEEKYKKAMEVHQKKMGDI